MLTRSLSRPRTKAPHTKQSAVLALVFALASCAATGPDNSSVLTLTTAQSSELTFRNLNKMMQQCLDSFAYQSNFFPEAKEGEITLKSKGDIFQATWIAVLIKPAVSGSIAQVTYRNIYETYTRPMQDWATGKSVVCP